MSPFYSLRVTAGLVVSVTGLIADAANAVEFRGWSSTWVAPENPKCTCRYKGEHLEIGAKRCLQTPEGPRTAECVTEQNVTSWRPSKELCPQAALDLRAD